MNLTIKRSSVRAHFARLSANICKAAVRASADAAIFDASFLRLIFETFQALV
jgi:hypothetical protein